MKSVFNDLHEIMLDTPAGVPTTICGTTDSFLGTLSPPIQTVKPKKSPTLNKICNQEKEKINTNIY